LRASPDFVRSNRGAGLLALSLTASKFGQRPSQLLGLLDPVVSLDFDNAGAMRLQEWEDERTAAMWGAKPDPEPDIRYEQIH